MRLRSAALKKHCDWTYAHLQNQRFADFNRKLACFRSASLTTSLAERPLLWPGHLRGFAMKDVSTGVLH
jgi:hypothetical protein